MPRQLSRPRDAGLSLVELMVAVVVLSIAVVGLFRLFDQSALAAGSDRDRLLAGLVAQNRAEELQLGLTDLPERVEMAGRSWRVAILVRPTAGGFEEVEIRVSSDQARAGAQLLTYRKAGAQP